MNGAKHAPLVFFNASVIIAGLVSTTGGSARLLKDVKEKQINGVISEIIVDEVLRHTAKIGKPRSTIEQSIKSVFPIVLATPARALVHKYKEKVVDQGDAHVLASCDELETNYLVTLDKKHLLSIAGSIKKFRIVSPGQLISLLFTKKSP